MTGGQRASCTPGTWKGFSLLSPTGPPQAPAPPWFWGEKGEALRTPGGGGVFARPGPVFPPQDPSLTILVAPLSLFSSFLSFMWAWAEGLAWQPREGVPLPPALAQAPGPYSSLQRVRASSTQPRGPGSSSGDPGAVLLCKYQPRFLSNRKMPSGNLSRK